jgi:Polyketide cyclase / dehydrase and lipid transport
MAHVEKSIEIQAPLSDVFAYVADYRHALEWMVGFEQFRPLTERTLGLGARVRASGRLIGFAISTDLEIVEYAENSHFTSESTGPIRSRTTWSFRPTAQGTAVTFSGDYRIHALPIPPLGDHILAHEVASHTALSMRHLRRIFEARARVGAPVRSEPFRADDEPRREQG